MESWRVSMLRFLLQAQRPQVPKRSYRLAASAPRLLRTSPQRAPFLFQRWPPWFTFHTMIPRKRVIFFEEKWSLCEHNAQLPRQSAPESRHANFVLRLSWECTETVSEIRRYLLESRNTTKMVGSREASFTLRSWDSMRKGRSKFQCPQSSHFTEAPCEFRVDTLLRLLWKTVENAMKNAVSLQARSNLIILQK